MATVVTDYTTQIDTIQPGVPSQYRLLKYIQGLIRNWACQQINIEDDRLSSIFFNSDSVPQQVKCIIGQAFDTQGKYAGTTPALVVSATGVSYQPRPSFPGGVNAAELQPCTQLLCSKRKIMNCAISIVTQSYDASLLLAQILSGYLIRNALCIAADCNMLDSFQVQKVDAPNLVETKMQSKQVYGVTIHITASGYMGWVVDTQGPVFKGVTVRTY